MMQARKTTIFNSSGLSLFENSEKDITGQNEASSYGGTWVWLLSINICSSTFWNVWKTRIGLHGRRWTNFQKNTLSSVEGIGLERLFEEQTLYSQTGVVWTPRRMQFDGVPDFSLYQHWYKLLDWMAWTRWLLLVQILMNKLKHLLTGLIEFGYWK